VKLKRIFPWLIVGFVVVIGAIQLIYTSLDLSPEDNYLMGLLAEVSAILLLPVTFASLGALIVTRRPGNRVGWLMIVTAIAWAAPLTGILEVFYPSPPTKLSLGLWVLLWLQNWQWLLNILPIVLIVLNFPVGRPPSPRWNWLNTLALGMLLFLAVGSIFWKNMGPMSGSWTATNPIGFIPESVGSVIGGIYFIGLVILALGGIASIFVRYRRAEPFERQQIKWLLFAGALSIMAIGLQMINYAAGPPDVSWFSFFLLISILTVPITIAFAILRYKLYDIDIIIRRTLIYGLLTGTLALIYFANTMLLGQVFQGLTGQQSPLAIVLSTLAIAALFSPLRRRIQDTIDRRFYRRKYDAEKTLANFSTVIRDQFDLNELSAELLRIIQETMEPEHLSLWLKERS
jgi:hypothetical protein